MRLARLQQRDGALPLLPSLLVVAGFGGCAWVFARAQGAGRVAVLALALVLAQGLLGGLTVVYRLPPTVLVLHLATSMLFLSVALVLAWRLRAAESSVPRTPLLWITAAAAYFQIVLGAAIRHTGAGLVCTDLPYCRGAIWPTGVHPAVHMHMLHRAVGLVVLALVCWNAVRLARGATGAVRALAWAGPALAMTQIVLGILTIVTFKDLVPVTAHLLLAALLLADYVALLAMTREPAALPLALGVAA
jgi:heme A synthase